MSEVMGVREDSSNFLNDLSLQQNLNKEMPHLKEPSIDVSEIDINKQPSLLLSEDEAADPVKQNNQLFEMNYSHKKQLMIRDLSMIEHDESNFNRFTKKLNLKIKDVSFIDEPSQPRP